MKHELDFEDLISLVKGEVPYYSIFDHPSVKTTGHYIGGFHDKWIWEESQLRKLTADQLFNLYQLCKQSWK